MSEYSIDDLSDLSELLGRKIREVPAAVGWRSRVDHGEMISCCRRSAINGKGSKGVDQSVDGVLWRIGMGVCV